MPSYRERIELVIDYVGDKATAGLRGLRDAMNDADGITGKFKAGFGAAGDYVKAHAVQFTAAAGAAIGAFVIKGVADFNSLALKVGEFADKTGVLPEEASRLIEAFGDVGIEAETVEGAITKLITKLGTAPGQFADLGYEAARTKDGILDTNESFVRAIETLTAIEDPSQRAAAGTRLFGRQWKELAEVIESGNVREALAAVTGDKLIDAKEVEQARALRDAIDRLKTTSENASLKVGGSLTPALAELTDTAAEAVEAFGKLDSSFRDYSGGVGLLSAGVMGVVDPLKGMREGFESVIDRGANMDGVIGDNVTRFGDLATATGDAVDPLEDAEAAADDMGSTAQTTARRLADLEAAWDSLTGRLNDESRALDVADGFDAVRQAATDAYTAAAEGSEDAGDKARDYRQAVLDQQLAVADYLREVLKLPPEVATDIIALLDQGKIDEAELKLAEFTRRRDIDVAIRLGAIPGIDLPGPKKPSKAIGGAAAGGPTLLHADEVVDLPPGTWVHPANSPTSIAARNAAGAGGPVTIIHQYMPTAVTPTAVARANARYVRRNGPA